MHRLAFRPIDRDVLSYQVALAYKNRLGLPFKEEDVRMEVKAFQSAVDAANTMGAQCKNYWDANVLYSLNQQVCGAREDSIVFKDEELDHYFEVLGRVMRRCLPLAAMLIAQLVSYDEVFEAGNGRTSLLYANYVLGSLGLYSFKLSVRTSLVFNEVRNNNDAAAWFVFLARNCPHFANYCFDLSANWPY